MYTACIPTICILPVYQLYVYCLYTIYMYTACMPTICILPVYQLYVYCLYTNYMYTACIPTICTLPVYQLYDVRFKSVLDKFDSYTSIDYMEMVCVNCWQFQFDGILDDSTTGRFRIRNMTFIDFEASDDVLGDQFTATGLTSTPRCLSLQSIERIDLLSFRHYQLLFMHTKIY